MKVIAFILVAASVALADDCPDGKCAPGHHVVWGRDWVVGSSAPDLARDPVQYDLSNLAKGWFEPAIEVHEHVHPLVHGFLVETAFTHRSMLTEASFSGGNEAISVEFDMPASRRLSILIDVPWVLDYANASGIGDLALGVRGMLVGSKDYILSAILEVGLPTGDYDVSLNEVSLGFKLANWWYAGDNYSVQSNIGIDWAPEISDSEAFVGSLLAAKTFEDVSVGGVSFDISGYVEGGLEAPFDGETVGELGLGIMFSVTKALEVRLGYYWSFGEDDTLRIGTIWEF